MLSTEAISAVVVRIPLPRRLARLRAGSDGAAGVGVPPHVTVLFPFLPAGRLDRAVQRELAAVAAAHEPFDVRFERVGRFPNVAYLAPEPPQPFRHLTEAIVARFPDFPPYGGAFEEVIPHLTVVEAKDAPLDEIAAQAATFLPLQHRVTALDVLVEDTVGSWHGRWRIPLGVRR